MPQIKAGVTGQRYWIEIPRVEWILNIDGYRIGKQKDGSLVFVDRYNDVEGGIGWIVYGYQNFRAVLDAARYEGAVLRALAHKLGIHKLRWRRVWLDTDDFLTDHTSDAGELKAENERIAAKLEAEGRPAAARQFREQTGLAAASKS
jgi:hypothetical protein